MDKLSIYTITSPLHDAKRINAVTEAFLGKLGIDFSFKDDDYSDYGDSDVSVIYVRTGGTENEFLKLVDDGIIDKKGKTFLLASDSDNSLAASMEILSFLGNTGRQGEIIHGSSDHISHRLSELMASVSERHKMARLGVIGHPSDWLISSGVDYGVLKGHGIELVDIPISELVDRFNQIGDVVIPDFFVNAKRTSICEEYVGDAIRVYKALKSIIDDQRLSGFTLRCFDLLTAIKNTGCLALAMLNAEGKVATCEGDIPAMLSMWEAKKVVDCFGFQANPSRIDVEKGEMVFAHCTIPLNMISQFSLDTHFESGIGVAIRGKLPEGPVTIFKMSGDMKRRFVAEGEIVRNLNEHNLCRTQIQVRLDNPSEAFQYFFTNPIGNHHIILPGRIAHKLL